MQRVITNPYASFTPLESTIHSSFLPSLFCCEISPLGSELFSLPIRWGGLGICLPKHTNQLLHNASRGSTHVIVNSIKNIHSFELDAHDDMIASAHKDYQQLHDSLFDDMFYMTSSSLGPLDLRGL